MPHRPWSHRPVAELRRESNRLLAEWIAREVRPHSAFWRDRLPAGRIADRAALRELPVVEEAQVAGAGGPGNPALLLNPTEAQFKRHARFGELLRAAREAGGGPAARRAALWRRYKPVHVHEAGADRLVAIAYTRSDLDRLHLAGARLAEVLGLGADDALVNLVPAGPSIRFWGLYHMALAARMTALHPRGAGQTVQSPAARALRLLPATVIAVPVDDVAALVERLVPGGGAGGPQPVPLPNLRTLLLVGPPPSPADRVAIAERVSRAAGRTVRVRAVWAPEASRVLYGEAPTAPGDPPEATYGLLTYPDLELLEVRDPATGEVVGPEEEGELVVTSLGWRGTALVRYATGAWVGGILDGRVHPVTGATVPRLAPAAVDGAWQPLVEDGAGGRRRVDLRRAHTRLTDERLAPLRVEAWSLKAIDGRLVLGLDTPVRDQQRLGALAQEVGDAVGVVPEVRVGSRTSRLLPQVGQAGQPWVGT